MAKQTPLQIVKDQYGSKDKLVAAAAKLLETPEGEDQDDWLERLSLVSNRKLLHLVDVGERAKKLGGRDKVVAAVADLSGKAKDKDYVAKLGGLSLSRLLDLHGSLSRKAKRAAKKAN